MIIYFDSSALIKSLINEPGSEPVKAFITKMTVNHSAGVIFSTASITYAEVMAALAAMRRGKEITQSQFERAVREFKEKWNGFSLSPQTDSLTLKAGSLGLDYKLKGCDAYQIAAALEVKADLLVSSDNDLNTAASKNALPVWNPMTEPIPAIEPNAVGPVSEDNADFDNE